MIRRPLIWALALLLLGEIVVFLLGFPLYSSTSLDEAMSGGSLEVQIRGTIEKITITDSYSRLTVVSCDVFRENNTTALKTHGIFVYASDLSDYKVGMQITVTGTLVAFDEPDNYGEFNKRLYYRTCGIDYMISADDIDVIAPSDGALLATISDELSRSIDRASSSEDEAGIFKAVLLGDKGDLSDETYDSFRTCGIAHILAISGLHLSLLAEAVLKLLKKLYLPNALCYALAEVLLLLYVIMIDGHASAWRAFIMFTASIIARLVGRTYDLLSALGLAGILLLIMQPLYAVDGAFQLSFGAIAGIGIVFTRLKACTEALLEKRLNLDGFIFNKLISPLVLSFSIQVMTLPILAYHYYEVSIYGVLLNLIVIPLMSVALFSIISSAVVGLISNILGSFFLGGAHYIFIAIQKLCELTSELPASQIVIGKPALWQIALYYLLLALLLFAVKKRKVFAIALLFIAPVLLHMHSSNLEITALYVGQGDCSVIALPNGHAVIIDCGSTSKTSVGKNVVLPFLKASRITNIDAVFLSHADEDHTNGVGELLADGNITAERVVIPKATSADEAWLDVMDAARDCDVGIYFMDSGEEYKDKDVRLLSLYPTSSASGSGIATKSSISASAGGATELESTNDTSLVLLLRYQDFTALFPGDIGEEGEKTLVKSGVLSRVDYLKCAHHGSKYSSSEAFLLDVLPKVTVISVGRKNRYGHPSAEAIERLEKAYSKIFRNDLQGMITTEVTEEGEIIVRGYK